LKIKDLKNENNELFLTCKAYEKNIQKAAEHLEKASGPHFFPNQVI